MMRWADDAIRQAGFEDRIQLMCKRFQDLELDQPADAVISNSLVHHVPNAFQFWYAVKTLAKPGAPVLIMDPIATRDTGGGSGLGRSLRG